jgi:hypothetical protein
VGDLGRYKTFATALQETKWFGDAVYRLGRSVVLVAGKSTPAVGLPRQRVEG